MSSIIHFESFLLAGILLNITPGNDTIFILSRSMAQGKQAGLMSVLGITTGSIIHTTLAALGLSVILAKSPLLFQLVKYAGAAYLIYMGYRMLRDKSNLNVEGKTESEALDLRKVFRDAVITNVLNPKVALFFLAFLPQFIDAQAGGTVLPFFILGLSFTLTGLVWCTILVFFASFLFSKLKQNKNLSFYINKVCGGIFVALGLKVALG